MLVSHAFSAALRRSFRWKNSREKFSGDSSRHRTAWANGAGMLGTMVAAGQILCDADTSQPSPNTTLRQHLGVMFSEADKNLPGMLSEASAHSMKGRVTGRDDPATARYQGLPVYRASEVAKHKDAASRVWVTYKDGVYDVTDFIALHPGGSNRIMLAAGSAVDPFWSLYAQHQKEYVQELLHKYLIGKLHPDDVAAAAAAVAVKGPTEDPYANEPTRHPALRVRAARPYNAEPVGPLLVDAYITPTPLMFVRNHMPVPDVKESEYALEIDIPGRKEGPLKLTLADLKSRFPKCEVTAAIQCAGNRRADMSAAKQARGLGWEVGAIANVKWGGARLRDVLRSAGVDVDAACRDGRVGGPDGSLLAHVQFEGLDSDKVSGTTYGASVPVDLACDVRGEALLAYEMNGETLTRDHGYPVRVVTPGLVGARQVKWLGTVRLAVEESTSLWQRKDYKAYPSSMDWDSPPSDDTGAVPSMQDMPVTSAIADPPSGTMTLLPGQTSIPLRGWAWSGGGRAVVRVEVTTDGGRTWIPAVITSAPEDSSASRTRSWGWTLWEAEVPVVSTGAAGPSLTVQARAMDVACNVQPSSAHQVWNWRGLANNSWHTVQLTLQQPQQQTEA